jgi:hypothetical protein
MMCYRDLVQLQRRTGAICSASRETHGRLSRCRLKLAGKRTLANVL